MNRVKNQHYVPRFYLKIFCVNSKIHVIDKSTKKIYHTKVENIANENYFYDYPIIDGLTGKNQFLEKYFIPLESKTSYLLSKLLEKLGYTDTEYEIQTNAALLQAKMILNRKFVRSIYKNLQGYIWQIIINKTEIPFYTSDHPVVKRAHIVDPLRSFSGILSKGIEICFPINRKYLLLIAERSFFNHLKNSDGKVLKIEDPQNSIYFN